MSEIPQRQRIGAYAVVRRVHDGTDQILMTRMSDRTLIAGRWTLPGGGIDHGEDPWVAVVREVYEETGLRVVPGRVLTVTSTHRVGSSYDGTTEDYHGVHIVFEATVDEQSKNVEPRVTEADSSTDLAVWMAVEDARTKPLLTAAAEVLGVSPGSTRSNAPRRTP